MHRQAVQTHTTHLRECGLPTLSTRTARVHLFSLPSSLHTEAESLTHLSTCMPPKYKKTPGKEIKSHNRSGLAENTQQAELPDSETLMQIRGCIPRPEQRHSCQYVTQRSILCPTVVITDVRQITTEAASATTMRRV